MQKREVKISVVFSGMPGASSFTTVTGRKYGDYISVSFVCRNGDTYKKRRKVRARTIFDGLEKVLVEESGPYFHEPYENLSDYDTEITGTTHWQKIYLLFCFGQDNESNINLGRRFASLSVAQKKDIFGQLETVGDLKEFAKECWEFSRFDSDDGPLEDVKSIIQYFNIKKKNNLWATIKAKIKEDYKKSALQVEEYARQREIEIRPYVEYARRAVFREIGRPAIAHGLHKSAMMRAIIEYIEMYIEKNGSYPKGKHTVQRLVHASPWGSNKHYKDEIVEFPD
jgi:hypothetical protein